MVLIAILMKENTILIRSMAMVYFYGRLVMSTRVITRMMKEMDMVRCIGSMDLFIKENGEKVFNMDMV